MKVTLIKTGGTIGSERDKSGVISPVGIEVPLGGSFDVECVTPFYELSERLNFSHYALLIRSVAAALTASDAVIITHGSDTLPFTAGVLAFALGPVNIPVVFVSADRPLSHPDSSGPQTLNTAAAFIKTKTAGVFVADRSQIHFAARLLEARAFDGLYFSALDKICARVTDGEAEIIEKPRPCSQPPLPGTLVGKDIVCIKPYPNLNYDRIETLGAACVLHDAYHSGTACEAQLNRFARRCDCPLYLIGGTRGVVYASKAGFDPSVKIFDGITFPAMYAKLLVGLNRYESDGRSLDAYLKTDAAGEYFSAGV